MKRGIAFLLMLALALSLSACAGDETIASGETQLAETTRAAENEVLQTIVDECGMPFKLFSPTNRDLYKVTVREDHAKREAVRKYEDSEEQDDLSWEIAGDKLTLTGSWEESFTIDPEKMEAVSDLDGRVYRILAEQ